MRRVPDRRRALLNAQIPAVEGRPSELAALRYIDTVIGTGAPAAAGKRYIVHYTGWLKDGTKFDSSVDRNETFQFVQGRRQVITGWDIGFEGMKVGGSRRLFIPYELAYGEQGTGPIPGKAELIFDVELINVLDAPAVKPAVDILVVYDELAAKVMALAQGIPEAKFDKTFAGIFSHIAGLNRTLLEGAMKDDPAIKTIAPAKALNGKAETITELTASFDAVKKELDTARNGQLGADAELFGKADTRRGLFTALDSAVAEQLGRALEYAKSAGIAGQGFFEAAK